MEVATPGRDYLSWFDAVPDADAVRLLPKSAEALNGPRDAYVYFKHEEQGKGPEFVTLLKQSLNVER